MKKFFSKVNAWIVDKWEKYPLPVAVAAGLLLVGLFLIIVRVFGRARPGDVGQVGLGAVVPRPEDLGIRMPFVPAVGEQQLTWPEQQKIQERERVTEVPAPEILPRVDENLIRRLQADIARVTARMHEPEVQAYFDRMHGGIRTYLAGQRARLTEALQPAAAVGVEQQAIPTPPQIQNGFVPTPAPDADLIGRLQADIARVTARQHEPEVRAYFERVHGGIARYLAAQRERLAGARGGS